MSNDMARLLRSVVVIGILAGFALSVRQGARFLLNRVAPCDQPCRWSEEKGYDGAHPLDINLEIKTTRQPRSGAREVWYRADFTNRSCETLFLSASFMVSDEHERLDNINHEGIYVVLRNAAGTEPPKAESSAGSFAGFESDIHPYQQAPTSSPLQSIYGSSYIKIFPGQAASASQTILAPYHIVLHDRLTPTAMQTVAVPEPIALHDADRIYTTPPIGFRKLQTYAALPPGKYSAQLIFSKEQIWTQPRYSFLSYPEFFRRTLWLVAYGDYHRDDAPPHPVEIDLASPAIVFEAAR